jgi:predicted transcriptional regulator
MAVIEATADTVPTPVMIAPSVAPEFSALLNLPTTTVLPSAKMLRSLSL